MSATNNIVPNNAQDLDQSHRPRLKAIDILLMPCYIPIACIVCVFLGGRCFWKMCTAKPTTDAERQLYMRDQKLFRKETPPSLPAVRKRALTIPLQPKGTAIWKQKQKTLDQLQSPLFGQLPLEVRELIYTFYLTPDERPLHIFRRTDRRLGHCICTSGPDSHSHMPRKDWGYDHPSRTRAWQRDMNPKPTKTNNLLPLLKSCRRAYSEAVSILYTTNTFCFQDTLALHHFTRTILPVRRRQITRIQLPWIKTYLGFSHPDNHLGLVFEALEHLSNLQEIHIVQLATTSEDWVYVPWTYWIAQVKRKCNVRVIDDTGTAPSQYALVMGGGEPP